MARRRNTGVRQTILQTHGQGTPGKGVEIEDAVAEAEEKFKESMASQVTAQGMSEDGVFGQWQAMTVEHNKVRCKLEDASDRPRLEKSQLETELAEVKRNFDALRKAVAANKASCDDAGARPNLGPRVRRGSVGSASSS